MNAPAACTSDWTRPPRALPAWAYGHSHMTPREIERIPEIREPRAAAHLA